MVLVFKRVKARSSPSSKVAMDIALTRIEPSVHGDWADANSLPFQP